MVRFDRKAPKPLNTKDTATRARDAASRLEDYEHRLVASLSLSEAAASAEGAGASPSQALSRGKAFMLLAAELP